jgi:predicted  nucleic acid-binding Zn-ribbon protein
MSLLSREVIVSGTFGGTVHTVAHALAREVEAMEKRIAELEAALAASDAQRVAAVDGAEAYRQRLAKNERRIAELEWTLRETDGRLRGAYERRAWYEDDDEAQGLFARNRAALVKGEK